MIRTVGQRSGRQCEGIVMPPTGVSSFLAPLALLGWARLTKTISLKGHYHFSHFTGVPHTPLDISWFFLLVIEEYNLVLLTQFLIYFLTAKGLSMQLIRKTLANKDCIDLVHFNMVISMLFLYYRAF